MKVFSSISDWMSFRPHLSGNLGFVPTMGALHQGHISLVEHSLKENKNTLISIFLNPTQFNDPKDLEKYPSSLEQDIKALEAISKDEGKNLFLLTPSFEDIYPDDYTYQVKESELSNQLCGKTRPGHFDGVLTIVMKLINIADAKKAYFGEKDYQQYLLIKKMTEAFFHKTKIVPCPTVREETGLAMSSRNSLLSRKGQGTAPKLHSTLTKNISLEKTKEELEHFGFKVDYLEDHFDRRFAAAFLDDVRLIDNVER